MFWQCMVKQYYKIEEYHASRSIGYLLKSSSKQIRQRIEELFEKEEVTFVQWGILMSLRYNLAKTSAELCQHICHDSGALTRILDQLEKRGIIERKRSIKDRRIVELNLTDSGHKITDYFLPRIVGFYNNLLDDFTKEEIDTLISLLNRINSKLVNDNDLKENL